MKPKTKEDRIKEIMNAMKGKMDHDPDQDSLTEDITDVDPPEEMAAKQKMDSGFKSGKAWHDPDEDSEENLDPARMDHDPDEDSLDDPMINKPSLFKGKGVHIFIKHNK